MVAIVGSKWRQRGAKFTGFADGARAQSCPVLRWQARVPPQMRAQVQQVPRVPLRNWEP